MQNHNSRHTTLRDVAKQSGVSIKTVSRVVNKQGEISESTRSRVQAAIEQMGYRPNILARNLVNQRTDTLGVVAWGIDYYGPSRALLGVEQQSDRLGYSLLLDLLPQPGRTDVEPILNTLAARQVDGIVWAVPEVGDNRNWILPSRLKELPPIVFMSMQPRPGLAVIATDNRGGAMQATRHLIDQGRRTIGVITGPMDWWEARERYEGWQAMLLGAGLTPRASLTAEGDWSASSGEQAMQKLLAQAPDLDAVFACNDQMAFGALGVAYRLGKEIPRDLAVVGFDNTPESAFFWPPLTTVNQHIVEMGGVALQVLHKMIEARRQGQDDGEPTATILQPELVIRASSLSASEPTM